MNKKMFIIVGKKMSRKIFIMIGLVILVFIDLCQLVYLLSTDTPLILENQLAYWVGALGILLIISRLHEDLTFIRREERLDELRKKKISHIIDLRKIYK